MNQIGPVRVNFDAPALEEVQALLRRAQDLGMVRKCVPVFISLNRFQDEFRPALEVELSVRPSLGYLSLTVLLDGSEFSRATIERLKMEVDEMVMIVESLKRQESER